MRSRALVASLVAAAVVASVLGLREARRLQPMELVIFDQWVRFASEAAEPDPGILLVEIDENDIQELGHWPVSDRKLAEALRKLLESGATAIGLDLHRNLPVPPGETFLSAVLLEDPRIFAVRKFGDPGSEGIPGPPALRETERVGFNDILLDPDGVVRRGLLFQDDGDGVVDYSFALRVAIFALERDGIHPQPDPDSPSWLRLGAATLRPLSGNDGGYAGEDDAGYQILLDLAGAAGALESVDLMSLLRDEVEPARVRDRIVLVGTNARSLPDLFSVPFEPEVGIPGVELHGQMLRQLLRQARGETQPMRLLPGWQEALLVALLAAFGCALGFSARGVAATVGTVLVGTGALWLVGAWALRSGIWVPMVAPALAFVASVGVVVAWASSRERAQRTLLMQLFSAHVSPEIADEVWRQREDFFHNGRPRPQRLTATVLFLDIVNYTPRAEKMDPEDHMEWVNEFMGAMARTVQQCGGYVDDYFGDGLKADFGVPFARETEDEIASDARAAVDCADAMIDALRTVNALYRERGFPTIFMRIGIDTGPVVAGSVGSENKLKYTVLGDVAVTAQRMQALDGIEHDFDENPCRILVTERTRAHLGERFRCESLGLFSLKGKGEKVAVHRVLAFESRPE